MNFFFHSYLSYGCEYLCKSILAVLFLFYSKKYNVQLIINSALATAKAEFNILFPYAVELLFAGHNCAISRHFGGIRIKNNGTRR